MKKCTIKCIAFICRKAAPEFYYDREECVIGVLLARVPIFLCRLNSKGGDHFTTKKSGICDNV